MHRYRSLLRRYPNVLGAWPDIERTEFRRPS